MPELLAAWDRLNARRGDLPFLVSTVVLAALEVFGLGSERLLIALDGDWVVAMFVLVPTKGLRWRTFQPSQIPLGAWVAEADLTLRELGRSLLRGPLGPSLALSITQVDSLFVPRNTDAPDVDSRDYLETGWIDLNGSFEDYWSGRGKNLRQNLRKQRNRLAAEGVIGRCRLLTARDDMAPAIERYGAVESAGWKGAQGTAIHHDNAQGRFYRRLFESAAERGEAMIYEYLFDDRVVASDLCLRRNGTLVVLKTTYDESCRSYSPAFLLRQEVMEDLYRVGAIRRLEYYGRMMEWHTRWTNNQRALYHLTVYRWPLLKRIADWRRKRRCARQP